MNLHRFQRQQILFPIIITIIAGIAAPQSASLSVSLCLKSYQGMWRALIHFRNCVQHELANLITILLGITVVEKMNADDFLQLQTLSFLVGLLALFSILPAAYSLLKY